MEDRDLLREILRKLDDLENGVTRVVEALEADDKYRDRLEKLAEKERDDRHEQLEDALDSITTRIENIGASMRDLPERLLAVVERKINDYRTAKYEAMQAGAPAREPTPPQPYREQTGKIAVAAPDPDEVTLTPAQQRGIVKIAGHAWRWGRWTILPMGGWLAKWIHELITAAKSIGH